MTQPSRPAAPATTADPTTLTYTSLARAERVRRDHKCLTYTSVPQLAYMSVEELRAALAPKRTFPTL